MNIIEQINAEQMTRELPKFSPGDTVIVSVKVKEGNRERLQAFECVVIAIKNRGINSAFTVRKISHGTGVEGKTSWCSSPCQVVLPARFGRKSCAYQRKAELIKRGQFRKKSASRAFFWP